MNTENTSDVSLTARKRLLSILSKSPADQLAPLWDGLDISPEYSLLKQPEIGMVMVKAKAGGDGAPFNMGEMTVTRTVVQLDTGELGYGYTAGRDKTKSLTIALIDACYQTEKWQAELEENLVQPLAKMIHSSQQQHAERVDRTKVNFFTMVRGE